MTKNIIADKPNLIPLCLLLVVSCTSKAEEQPEKRPDPLPKDRPNILFIMSDDHTSQAISAYGGILSSVMQTPNLDRLAREGALLRNCFVTNSISAPSRAAIITGQYSQKNGVYTLLDPLSPALPNVAKELKKSGYQTALVGKWHLESEPSGFDYYNILPGQGVYHNPTLISISDWPRQVQYQGHSTDVITNQALAYLERTDKKRPFFLMCHYKAPHRPWQPAERFKTLLEGVTIPEPENLLDNYENRGEYTRVHKVGLEHMNKNDLKRTPAFPSGMTRDEKRRDAYQIYLKDYLRCVAGVDENVGRLLDYLDRNDLSENTIVIYTGDQGFFLGEHGWFDKRMMFEQALRMPFLIRYPKEIRPGTVNRDIILNIDFAPLFMDYAGLTTPSWMQGESFRSNLKGQTPGGWRQAMYYRYWQQADGAHNMTAHYGIRTDRYKLIFWYGDALGKTGTNAWTPAEKISRPVWELYDLKTDPDEMDNIYNDPKNRELVKTLKAELLRLKAQYGDSDNQYPQMQQIVDQYWD